MEYRKICRAEESDRREAFITRNDEAWSSQIKVRSGAFSGNHDIQEINSRFSTLKIRKGIHPLFFAGISACGIVAKTANGTNIASNLLLNYPENWTV